MVRNTFDDDDGPVAGDALRCPVCGEVLPVYAPADKPELPPECPFCHANLAQYREDVTG
jgi:hypothetical protein